MPSKTGFNSDQNEGILNKNSFIVEGSNGAVPGTDIKRVVKGGDSTIIVDTNKDVYVNTYKEIVEQRYFNNSEGNVSAGYADGSNNYINVVSSANRLAFSEDDFQITEISTGIAKISSIGGGGGNGATGATGPAGPTGATGISGFSGRSGFSGISGFSGVTGTSGYSGLTGVSGTSGYSGVAGVGATGISGFSGQNGPTGSSAGAPYYFNYSTPSGIGGYSLASDYIASGGEVTTTTFINSATPISISNFCTEELKLTNLKNGNYSTTIYVRINSGTLMNFELDIYVRDSSGTETLVLTSTSSSITGTGFGVGTPPIKVDFSSSITEPVLINPTDRLVFKLYASVPGSTSNAEVYYKGTTNASYINTPLTQGQSGFSGYSGITPTIFSSLREPYTPINNPSSPQALNFGASSIFYITNISNNFTANVTNLTLTANQVTNVVLILVQGVTPYIATAIQVAGVSQTIKWLGGIAPSGNANSVDVLSFSLVYDGTSYTVLGKLGTFS